MIGKLTGKLDSIHEGGCILDVNGVGYLIACSARTLSALPPPPATGSVLVETVVREDAITLYAFAEAGERDWFRLLTGIQGVGPKVALALLSALSPGDLAAAIMTGDKGSLTRANGVGAKLAQRLVAELRDRIGNMPTGPGFVPFTGAAGAAPLPTGGIEADAVSALLNLGWKRPEAAGAVARVIARLGEEAPLGTVIRDSLKELGR
jgi:holliday junction DNA helicase RuvA